MLQKFITIAAIALLFISQNVLAEMPEEPDACPSPSSLQDTKFRPFIPQLLPGSSVGNSLVGEADYYDTKAAWSLLVTPIVPPGGDSITVARQGLLKISKGIQNSVVPATATSGVSLYSDRIYSSLYKMWLCFYTIDFGNNKKSIAVTVTPAMVSRDAPKFSSDNQKDPQRLLFSAIAPLKA